MKFILFSLFHSAFPFASFRKFSTNDWFKLQYYLGNVIFLFIMLVDIRQGLLKEI